MDVSQKMQQRCDIERSSKRQEWQRTGDAYIDSHLDMTRPPNTKCTAEQYKTWVNGNIGDICQAFGLQDTIHLYISILEHLLNHHHFTDAFYLIYAPHSTMTTKPIIQYDTRGRMFLTSSLNGEKTRNDRRSDVIRQMPLMVDLDESVVQSVVDKADMNQRPIHLLRALQGIGYKNDLRSIRHFVATTLYFRLLCDEPLRNVSPRGWPAMINCALGHIQRSNQWCPYLLKNSRKLV